MTEFTITVTKDQLSAVGKAFIPFKKDDIRLSFIKDNIVFETSELGHTGKITLGSDSVKEEMLDISFFVSKSVLAKVESVMQESARLKFTQDGNGTWTAMSVDIGGSDDINIGLPIFEEEIDTAYTKESDESIDSEKLASALKAVECSVIPQGEILACLSLGTELTFGSNKSICVASNMLKNIQVKVSDDFRKHIANLTKIGTSVQVILGKGTRSNDVVVFKAENVEYKTALAPHRIPDMSRFATSKQCEFSIDIQALQDSITRISIPLMDADAPLIAKLNNGQLELSVFDIQGRHSGSKVPVTTSDTEGRICVQIKSLASVLTPLESTTKITASTNQEGDVVAIILEDSNIKTYLATSIE